MSGMSVFYEFIFSEEATPFRKNITISAPNMLFMVTVKSASPPKYKPSAVITAAPAVK
jgi:hypothetical protein